MYLLQKIYRPGYAFKKAGVIVAEIVPLEQVQASLFDKIDHGKEAKLNTVLDSINGRFVQDMLRMGPAKGKLWQMKREFLSPCYTTNFLDIPKIFLR